MMITSLCLSPFVLAKTRKTYLTDFMLDHQIKDEGFTNSEREDYREDSDDVSYQATAYALEILGDYALLEEKDIFGKETASYNSSDLQEELEDVLSAKYNAGPLDLFDTYYILKALNGMDYEISGTLALQITSYLASIAQSGGGFSGSPQVTTSDLASTYFAIIIYDLLDLAVPNLLAHYAFTLSCGNPDGGFGGEPGGPSTIASAYFAVLIAEYLEDIRVMPYPDLTVDYLNSFYVDDENDEDNYGGYLPDLNAKNAHICSTYFCIKAISIIDELIDEEEFEDKDATSEWVLTKQNFQDGGFVDISDGYEQRYSSVVNTYYAHEILDILGRTELLEEKVFMMEFETIDWVIFVIILVSLVALAVIGIIIWRKRKV